LAGSATLVARTVTEVAALTEIGDVYHPAALIAPGPETMLHVTPAGLAGVSVATNCCTCEGYIADPAPTETVIGNSVTVADADLLALATLVAVTTTVCCEEMGVGGVYTPELLTVPTAGLTNHVTAVLLVFVTVGVNCWGWLAVSETAVGAIVTNTPGIKFTVAVP